ncbi:MAG: ROK family protein [Planctomycetes bacterium]|nr:ROK family protein [Planctomycetota bacterium]MCH9727933.1 ROK family protein [Planctomycetota bacterium]MCH9778368.1 ROK family protein [Planctomycetota bacterium]
MKPTKDNGPYFVGVDIGGTNVKVGIVDDSGQTLAFCKTKTDVDKGVEAGLQHIYQAIEHVLSDCQFTMDDIKAIGIAAPGTMDIPGGKFVDPPNLPTWKGFPIRQVISDHYSGKMTIFQNDANAAAYGEYWVGGAQEAHSLVFWTLGTGIGCGIIIDEMIIEGRHSHGSECGHSIIQMTNGRLCDSGQYGTLEAYAGGKSLVRRCQEELDAGRDSLLNVQLEAGTELTPLLIAQMAEQGDDLSNELIMDSAMYLGVGTTTLMHTIDPDMVLFGGAVTFGGKGSELGQRFMNRIREEVKHRAFRVPYENTIIDFADLGSDAGYIGAAGCARLASLKAKTN